MIHVTFSAQSQAHIMSKNVIIVFCMCVCVCVRFKHLFPEQRAGTGNVED